MAEDYTPTEAQVRQLYANSMDPTGFDRWLAEVRREAWDEGAQAGLDTGLSIAEAVHANGGVLNLEDVPNAPVNPYRKEADRG